MLTMHGVKLSRRTGRQLGRNGVKGFSTGRYCAPEYRNPNREIIGVHIISSKTLLRIIVCFSDYLRDPVNIALLMFNIY